MIERMVFAAAALLATTVMAEPSSTPPPLDAYGKLPTIETIQISPDGKRLAYIVTDGEARAVAISDIETHKPILRAPAGNKKIADIQWAGADHLIMTIQTDTYVAGLAADKHAWSVPADIDLRQHRMHPFFDLDPADSTRSGENLNVILDAPQVRTVRGRTLVFFKGIHFDDGDGAAALFKYDPTAAESAGQTGTTLVQSSDGHTEGWLVGQDGEPLAVDDYNAKAQSWSVRVRSGGSSGARVAVPASIEHPTVVGLGRDGKSALIALPSTQAKNVDGDRLVELAAGQNAWGPPILNQDYDDLVFDPVTAALIGIGLQVGETRGYTFFDPADQKRWDGLKKAYPNDLVSLVSLSGDHLRWVLSVDSPSEGPAYALVDFTTGKAEWIGYNYDAASKVLAEKRPIAFKAADGLELRGYLTLPRGRDPKRLPLVVLPHGGPASQDHPGFNWWAQAIASRGYAVLQVQYRGSTGDGWSHLSAGFGQWGREMQTDLSDGVRYLAAEGVADPKRVCIVGASYGGYAALAGATLDRGVYRCAVSVAGISDPRRMVKWDSRDGDSFSSRYWLRYLGVESAGDPRLDEISPLRHVDKVTIPILLIHGKDDTVVDFSQSQLMYDALKRAGKDVQLVTLPHEDHWLLTGATRLQMLQATMDFLEKNNPPG